MKKIKLFPMILILCLFFSLTAPAAQALDEPDIQAAAAVLVDLDSGRILYERNKDKTRAPASLTKVMTALLAFEAIEKGEASLDDRVVAQSDCRKGMNSSSSTSGIQPGMELSLRELLYCALLQSANEACNVIGTHLAGSIKDFVARMNEKAEELGCTNTHFNNTNGLTDDQHYSTAYDLSLITRAAMEYPDFMAFCNTLSYQPENPKVNGGRTINNTNALLTTSSEYGKNYYYEYASGVKTGYTRAAGYCLISTANKDDIHVLAVVLGCSGRLNAGINGFRNFSSSIDLYNWAFDNFAYQTVLHAGDPVSQETVANAKGGAKAELTAAEDVTLLLPKDLQEGELEQRVDLDESLAAPLSAGTAVGRVDLLLNGEVCASTELVNTGDVALALAESSRTRPGSGDALLWPLGVAGTSLVLLALYLAAALPERKARRRLLRGRKS